MPSFFQITVSSRHTQLRPKILHALLYRRVIGHHPRCELTALFFDRSRAILP